MIIAVARGVKVLDFLPMSLRMSHKDSKSFWQHRGRAAWRADG